MTLPGPAPCIHRAHRSYAAPPLTVMAVSDRPSCRLVLLEHHRKAKTSLCQGCVSRSARQKSDR